MIYVLGASGFLGKVLQDYFESQNVDYVPIYRDISSDQKPSLLLSDFIKNLKTHRYGKNDIIINCIGTAHLDYKIQKKYPDIYYEANVEICVELAELAIKSNVDRFIHVSSISVLGDNLESIVRNDTRQSPRDAYGKSKNLAEQKLNYLFNKSSSKLIIVRPAMVYGVGASGNFEKLCNLLSRKILLPIAGLDNTKSFLSDLNFASFIHLMCSLDVTENVTFNLADLQQFSMLEFIKKIAFYQGNQPFIFYFPLSLLQFMCRLLNKKELYEKLTENFIINMTEVVAQTCWVPHETQQEALKRVMDNQYACKS